MGRSPFHKLYFERNLVNKRKLALGYKAQNQFVYSLSRIVCYPALCYLEVELFFNAEYPIQTIQTYAQVFGIISAPMGGILPAKSTTGR